MYGVSPFACVTIFISSVYWFALSYGAITILQVFGHDEGKMAMEQADPMTLLLGLPSIPIFLLLGKFIHWEDSILKIWRRYHHILPLLKYITGSSQEKPREITEQQPVYQDVYSDPLSITRMISGALILPSIATLVGQCFFTGISSKFHRTLLVNQFDPKPCYLITLNKHFFKLQGGFTFIVVKGMFKIYLKQQHYIRKSNRKVLNYVEEDISDGSFKQAPKDQDSQSLNYSD